MAITPSTNLYLLQVPIEIDNANQLTFANATSQHDYFFGLTKDGREDFTYQRKDSIIRYPANIDSLMHFNYVMYQNENYSNKWFYAFITGMQYINDNMTEITITTDVYQTWMFDIELKQSFVEREHVNDDTVGLHTIPEGIETGEMVMNGDITDISMIYVDGQADNYCYYCFQVTEYPVHEVGGSEVSEITPALTNNNLGGRVLNGTYTGLKYLIVAGTKSANNMIRAYDRAGKANAIVSIFQIPPSLATNAPNMTLAIHHVNVPSYTSDDAITLYNYNADNKNPIVIENKSISKPTTINGYSPKNGKMLCYPFNYFYMTNNGGSEVVYRYEDFNGNPSFKVDGAISQGCSIKCYPTNYKNGTDLEGYNFGMNAQKLPVCGWDSDFYVNWCTQNAVNIPLQIGRSVVASATGAVSSAVSKNPLGVISAIGGTVDTVFDVIAQKYEADLTPNQAKGNVNSGDINIAEKKQGFTIYPMSVRAEYARIADNYLSMFGYKVNELKVPNITGRSNWNYVKTADVNIEGYIPQEDLQTIKDMLNTGVTFWHNPATFLDYSQSNNII